MKLSELTKATSISNMNLSYRLMQRSTLIDIFHLLTISLILCNKTDISTTRNTLEGHNDKNQLTKAFEA